MIRIAVAICVVAARLAAADPEHDADAAFRRAEDHALAGDPGAIDELEALGRARPVTRWTDDAWREAARLAERAGDLPRARSDLEAALAVTTDPLLARRVRATLVRLEPLVDWSAVGAAHGALVNAIQRPGDPKSALVVLGAVVLANPGYPSAVPAMLALARGWERDGAPAAARTWLERAAAAAPAAEREHVTAERARFELRGGDIDAARDAIAALHRADLRAQLAGELARAAWRKRFRGIAWVALGLLAAAAIDALRRDAGGWRAAARRLARPPLEVWFLAPIAAVLIGIAATGNPLVSRAVRVIAIAGVAVAWLSAAIGAPRSARRAGLRAGLAAIAVLAATYLAVDRDRMIDIVIETWHSGPAAR